jgi:hypothetical protein
MSAAREAKPSEGPKGPSPRDCGEADAQAHARYGRSNEAEA